MLHVEELEQRLALSLSSSGFMSRSLTQQILDARLHISDRREVALAFADSDERAAGTAAGLYRSLLGRPAAAWEAAAWAPHVRANYVHALAQILASEEYVRGHPDWVASVYRNVLGREADPGRVWWDLRLVRGASRVQVALGITGSDEGQRRFVADKYVKYLNRSPSEAEYRQWRNDWTSRIDVGLLTSPDYLKNAMDVPTWVKSLYTRVLGRSPDPNGYYGWLIHMAGGNVLVNNRQADAGTNNTQSETSVSLTNAGVLVAFNDSGSYVKADLAKTDRQFTGFAYSADGRTFVDGGVLPVNPNGDAGDPVLARDEKNNILYLVTLSYGATVFNGPALFIFRSYDNGRTWTAPVNSAPGYPVGFFYFLDKPWLTVDNFEGGGQGNVYQLLRNFPGLPNAPIKDGIYLTRSTDRGATWGPAGGVKVVESLECQGAWVEVGPDHSVYAFWYEGGQNPRIVVRKSSDRGLTFGPEATVASLRRRAVNGDLGLEFRSNSFPQVAISRTTGHIYVVYNDGDGRDRGNIYLVHSPDGTSWSSPVKVNDDTGAHDQWQPTIAVTPNGLSLGVFWYDRRADPSNYMIHRYGAAASLAGTTPVFGSNFRVTDRAFPPVVGQDALIHPKYMGDYDQTVADDVFFYTVWADNRHGDPDVMMTRVFAA